MLPQQLYMHSLLVKINTWVKLNSFLLRIKPKLFGKFKLEQMVCSLLQLLP